MIRPRHLVSLGALAVALVFTDAVSPAQTIVPAPAEVDMNVEDQPGIVPSPDQEQLNGPWEKQVVFYRTSEPPGTIIIVTAERFLYLVQGNNRAIRYGIGVGREGFQWSGLQKISRKQEWPDWRPPPEMIVASTIVTYSSLVRLSQPATLSPLACPQDAATFEGIAFSKAKRTASVNVSIGVVVQFICGAGSIALQIVPFGPKSTLTQRYSPSL